MKPWQWIVLVLGGASTVMGGLAAIGLKDLRPVWYHEKVELQEFAVGTRRMVLSDKWFQLQAKKRFVEEQLASDPNNIALRELQVAVQRQIRETEQQQRELEGVQ